MSLPGPALVATCTEVSAHTPCNVKEKTPLLKLLPNDFAGDLVKDTYTEEEYNKLLQNLAEWTTDSKKIEDLPEEVKNNPIEHGEEYTGKWKAKYNNGKDGYEVSQDVKLQQPEVVLLEEGIGKLTKQGVSSKVKG